MGTAGKSDGGFHGPMERQQISGGKHDRLSNARQREPGSSRKESDFTAGREKEEPTPPAATAK